MGLHVTISPRMPVIGLIAVAPAHQARGHAAAVAHYAPRHSTISVTTQQSNLRFAATGFQLAYHFVP
jgi:hypothetical protein